jgi:DNA-binding response OmpR family regulator
MKSQKRVLIVDDDPQIGKICGLKLKLAGFDVITTTKGIEAVEMVCTQAPDIVLLDIIMPDLTGFGVLYEVRKFSKIPIVVFTAHKEYTDLAMKNGANDYLTKPFNPDYLVEKITTLLNKANQTQVPN